MELLKSMDFSNQSDEENQPLKKKRCLVMEKIAGGKAGQRKGETGLKKGQKGQKMAEKQEQDR